MGRESTPHTSRRRTTGSYSPGPIVASLAGFGFVNLAFFGVNTSSWIFFFNAMLARVSWLKVS